MINKEAIDWFNEHFDCCYHVKCEKYPNSIFMFYDKNYVRQLKIAKLDGISVEKNIITGECLFEQDWENDILWCAEKIRNYLYDNNINFSFLNERMNNRDLKLSPYFTKVMFGVNLDDSNLTIIKYEI